MQKAEATLPGSYEQAAACLENRMRLKYSFDMIGRRLTVAAGRPPSILWTASSRTTSWKKSWNSP